MKHHLTGLGIAALLLGGGLLPGGVGWGWPTARAGEGPAEAEGAAAAETPAAAYPRIEAEVKTHLRERAYDELKVDCAAVLARQAECEDVALRTKYRTLLGSILAGCRRDDVQKVALEAIGQTGDPALFRYVRPHLAMPNAKEAPPLLETAIATAGRLAADDAAQPLVGLVKDSKVLEISQAAMKALGNYGANKRVRVRIVGDLISTVRKDRPGVGSRADTSSGQVIPTARTRTGDEAQSRWQSLAPSLVEALNKMTGQGCATAEDWFDLWDRYKSQPQTLFPSRG